MNRRQFSQTSFSFLSSAVLPLSACRQTNDAPPVVLPAFSQVVFHAQLEALRLAYEAKGQHVSSSLLPPLNEVALRERCAWFPAALPQELTSLYAWHGGQDKKVDQDKFPFWFRDCGFISPNEAEREYKDIMSIYGQNPMDHELLKYSFPFAAFNSGWLVLPCKGQSLDLRFPRPVIFVMEGITVFFYSMQLMIDTCVEWVSHPQLNEHAQLPPEIELKIWQKHNPGIFADAH